MFDLVLEVESKTQLYLNDYPESMFYSKFCSKFRKIADFVYKCLCSPNRSVLKVYT